VVLNKHGELFKQRSLPNLESNMKLPRDQKEVQHLFKIQKVLGYSGGNLWTQRWPSLPAYFMERFGYKIFSPEKGCEYPPCNEKSLSFPIQPF
jgi:hypothetical protein